MAELIDPGAAYRNALMQSLFRGRQRSRDPSVMTEYQSELLKLHKMSEARYQEAEAAREAAEKERASAEQTRIGLERRKQEFEEFIGTHKEARETEATTADIGLKHAETTKAKVETTKAGEETKSIIQTRNQGSYTFNWQQAAKENTQLAADVASGTVKWDADNSREFLNNQRLLTGNPKLTLPMDQNGVITLDPRHTATMVGTATGNPSLDYSIALRNSKRLEGSLGRAVNNYVEGVQSGNIDPKTQDALWAAAEAEIRRATKLSPDDIIGNAAFESLLRTRDAPGAIQLAHELKTMYNPQKWDAKDAVDWSEGNGLYGDLQDIMARRETLIKSGKLPQDLGGRLWSQYVSADSDVQNLQDDLQRWTRRYISHEYKKGSDPKASAQMVNSIPGILDDPAKWDQVQGIADKLRHDNALMVGLAKSRNQTVPDGLEFIMPEDEVRRTGTLGMNVLLHNNGQIPGADADAHYKGQNTQTDQAARDAKKIGGPEEARDKSVTTTPSSGTTSTTDFQSLGEFNPKDYKNPDAVWKAWQEYHSNLHPEEAGQ